MIIIPEDEGKRRARVKNQFFFTLFFFKLIFWVGALKFEEGGAPENLNDKVQIDKENVSLKF